MLVVQRIYGPLANRARRHGHRREYAFFSELIQKLISIKYRDFEAQFGKELKEVLKSMKMVAEGVETCRSVYELAAKNNIDVPIVDAVYQILFNDKDPSKITYDLMTRDMKPEH